MTITAQLADWAPRTYLGESPRWHDGHWWWVDATVGKIFRHRPGDDAAHVWLDLDGRSSLVHPGSPDGMLVAAGTDLRLYPVQPDGAAGPPEAFHSLQLPESWSVNDGAGAPGGGLYIGVVSPERDDTGYLQRIYADGTLGPAHTGVHLSNGIAFAGEVMYHVDSYRRTINAYTLDSQGDILDSRVHIVLEEGYPDGIATDLDGHLWVAVYGTGEVRRFDTSGKVTDTVSVPTPQATSVALGGADGRDLLITTAREGYDEARSAAEPLAGRLFTARATVAGAPVVPVGSDA